MGLSTHILDTASGRPAANVALTLYLLDREAWSEVGQGITDVSGRCSTLLHDHALQASTYKIRFATAEYYGTQNIEGLYPWVEIVFRVASPQEHFHLPLLLTANGYTTYRGS